MLVRPIAERFHAQGALVGLWADAMPKGVAHVPPAHEMIDPLKDTTALIAQVRAGFMPQPEAAGAFGCPSSNDLRPLGVLCNGASGPSAVKVMLRFGDASSGGAGWFCA
jgi:hypothetical protein